MKVQKTFCYLLDNPCSCHIPCDCRCTYNALCGPPVLNQLCLHPISASFRANYGSHAAGHGHDSVDGASPKLDDLRGICVGHTEALVVEHVLVCPEHRTRPPLLVPMPPGHPSPIVPKSSIEICMHPESRSTPANTTMVGWP